MKQKISFFMLVIFLSGFLFFGSDFSAVSYAEEEKEKNYDPLHTMLALNMAIVSVHRIISTQDRIILDQEYNTIINRLALGNIESDREN